MLKTVLRELIIILLLCLAIILILGILLYKYVPMSKVLPEEVSYTTPENIQKEITQTEQIEPVTYTYEVNSQDLNTYKRVQDYQPGKANPFSSYATNGENTTTSGSATGGNSTSSGNSTTNSSSNSGSSTSNTTTSGGEYFQDKGTK